MFPSWPWQRLKNAVLDLLFPPNCITCHTPGNWLCASCRDQIPYLSPADQRQAHIPGSPGESWVDSFHSVAYHEGIIREAIHAFKYDGVSALAPSLGELLAEFWEANGLWAEVLVPVPLHPRRLRERGYNQSLLLAEALGTLIGVPMDHHALQRMRYTLSQVGLDAQERQENVSGAFACQRSSDAQYVALIDDVCTTGATLAACAHALKEQGVRYVLALTLACPRR